MRYFKILIMLIFLKSLILHAEENKFEVKLYQSLYNYPSIPYEPYLIPEDYKISPGDTISIDFYGYLNTNIIKSVPLHGKIVIFGEGIPSLGVFEVKGKTVKEVEEEINERLKEGKYPETRAIVSVVALGSIRIYIAGDVPHPGSYLVSPISRLTDVIVYTQGLDFNLREVKGVKIIRKNESIFSVQIENFIKKGDLNSNPFLKNEDIIVIEK